MSVREKGSVRGVWLSALLILFALFEVVAMVLNFLVWRQVVTHGFDRPGVPLGAILWELISLVALVGVWLWQRRAMYVLAGAVLVSAVYDSVFGLSAVALLIRVVVIGALAWCIRQRWEAFR
jgi:hypothetical protein